MFPWVFEWDYEIGHYALLGAWYCVLTVMGLGLTVAFLKTLSDLRKGGGHGGGHH
jgi:hypothetical protein